MLKKQSDTYFPQGGGFHAIVIMKIAYEKLENGIWFPKAGTNVILLNKETGEKELLVKHAMQVKSSELDADVSDLFELDIPPETMLWDYRVGCQRTAREAGII